MSYKIPIIIVSTYGANYFLESALAKYETLLRESSSFCNLKANVLKLYLEQTKNLICFKGAHAILLMMWNEEEFFILPL